MAAWCPRSPCCRAVLVVARPDGVCPAEPPAGIQRSGIVAVVDTARTPAMAAVAGRCPTCGVHPSGVVRVRPSGVRPSGVRSPTKEKLGFWTRRRAFEQVRHGSNIQLLSYSLVESSSGGPAVWCPPVQRPALWCPSRRSGRLVSTRPVSSRLVSARRSGRVRLVPPQAVALETRSRRPGDRDHRNGARSVGGRAVGRFGRRPRRPGAGDAAEVARWPVGVGDGPGPSWVTAAAAALDR